MFRGKKLRKKKGVHQKGGCNALDFFYLILTQNVDINYCHLPLFL